nr:reverse transcriptase domain-containing protein [Tanacetum cinerariifolium]
MTTLAEHIIVAGAENCPPMLEKSMYDSWACHIHLFIKRKKHGRLMFDSIDNGLLVYLTVEENRQTRPKKYFELTKAQQLQDDYDVQATISFFTVFHPMFVPNIVEIPVVMMADQRTMAELLQAPTEGYKDAIIVTAILAVNFELKHSLLNLVTSKQFYGHDEEDLHAYIRWFNKITSTMRYLNVSNTSIKLMLFPFSIDGAAQIWLEKEPPHLILTWEDLVCKFINQFFPPSKITNLRNEIKNFEQRFGESFCEAWDHFKDLLRTCPHHGFTELHQLDTFYIAINPTDQDSLNSDDWMNATRSLCFPEVVALTDAVKDLLRQNKNPSPASVKAVEDSYVTCGGPHPYYSCTATDGNVFKDNIQEYISAAVVNYNQENTRFRPQVATNYHANQISPPGFPPVQNNQNRYNQNQNQSYNQNRGNYQAPIQHPQVELPNEVLNYKKITETSIRAMQNQITNSKAEMKNEIHSSMQNQINNVKNELRSDMSNQTNELRNMMASFFQKNTVSTSGSEPLPSNTIANPRGDLKAITTRSGVSYNGPLISPPFSSLPKVVERVPEVTKDTVQPSMVHIVYSWETCLEVTTPSHANVGVCKSKEKEGNDTLVAINQKKNISLPELTPTRMILKLADRSTTRLAGITKDVFVKVGKFHFPIDFIDVDYVFDPRVHLILRRPFLRTRRALINVYGKELTLRVDDEAITFKVGQTLKYSYNDADSINQIDVINVACEEYVQEVLGIFDNSKGGNPTPILDHIIALFPSLSLFLREATSFWKRSRLVLQANQFHQELMIPTLTWRETFVF